jgi:hypothetical protein
MIDSIRDGGFGLYLELVSVFRQRIHRQTMQSMYHNAIGSGDSTVCTGCLVLPIELSLNPRFEGLGRDGKIRPDVAR